MKKIVTVLLFLTFSIQINYALPIDYRKVKELKINAVRLNETIKIDGILSERIWNSAHAVGNFTQKDPVENSEPSELTKFYIAYDDNAIYFGARMYDSSPDSIISRLARRDETVNSDRLLVFLDPYNDDRSGFYFGVSAAGALSDGIMYNDDWTDNAWDGVWEGRANIDNKGWTVEMKIPFSQLRFINGNNIIWGINVKREIARKNELDYLVYVPKNVRGFVSHFADLRGLKNIKPPSRFEVLPYVTTKAEYTQHDANDPFNNGSKYKPDFGADLKYGLGPNLTLDATINPDFGQVEIDPAVINLSDVETYFGEKRPFFIEGSSIFNFGRGGASNYWSFNWSTPDFFYSRRIGRAPQGSLPDNDYAEYPSGTHILGAAKLTGKVGDNWNIGTIHALTSRETASIQYEGKRSSTAVEPMTYYGVFRGQKDFNGGRQGIGMISTYTSRMFKDDRLRNDINSSALTAGLDGWVFLDSSKTWVTSGWLGMSHITGNRQRMIDLQTSSRHYFQRPDAKNLHVDSTAASLDGYAGRFFLNKQNGNFFFNSAFGFISPSFDLNDVGFIWRANVLNMHIGAGYTWNKPTSFYRTLELGGAVFRTMDYEGNVTWEGIFHFGYLRFLNYYSFNWNLAYNPQTTDNRKTRGGPLTLSPAGYQVNFSTSSDSRKSWAVGLSFSSYVQPHYSYSWSISPEFEFRPGANILVSFSPSFDKNKEDAQYVDTFSDPYAKATYGKRYVFAELDQTTVSAGIRLNWTFTPQLSLQLYAQPLISSGNYTGFKELARPRSYDFLVYGEKGSTFNNDTYSADPDGSGPAQSISIDNPDFNFVSLRGNAVLRWEYMPGSVLYFVWTQTRSGSEDTGNFQFDKSFDRILNLRPDNIFMIKFTYWLNM